MTDTGTETSMQIRDRAEAIGRAQRALKALGEHPRSSIKELGRAREYVNACYSHGSAKHVWNAVTQIEAMADRRHGALSAEQQRQPAEGRPDLEGPATATRGRQAEDRDHAPSDLDISSSDRSDNAGR